MSIRTITPCGVRVPPRLIAMTNCHERWFVNAFDGMGFAVSFPYCSILNLIYRRSYPVHRLECLAAGLARHRLVVVVSPWDPKLAQDPARHLRQGVPDGCANHFSLAC